MKKIALLLSLVLIAFKGTSQKTDTLQIHYFKNGKVSTIITVEDDRFGKALAYNQEGKIIYEKGVRRFAGSAMVYFKHYESGAVHKADYSSHPDGGIQWYKSYTIFSESGEIISEIEDSHDKHATLISPTQKHEKQPPKTVKQEIDKENSSSIMIHQNAITVINHTRYKLEIIYTHQNKDKQFVLESGASIEGPIYISAEKNNPPAKENINFRFTCSKKRANIQQLIQEETQAKVRTMYTIHLFESVRK